MAGTSVPACKVTCWKDRMILGLALRSTTAYSAIAQCSLTRTHHNDDDNAWNGEAWQC